MAMNPSEFTNSDDEQRAIEARCLTALAQREHSRAELVAKLPAAIPLSAIKELGFLLFHEAERKGDGADAQALNALVTSWGDVSLKARQHPSAPTGTQSEFDI